MLDSLITEDQRQKELIDTEPLKINSLGKCLPLFSLLE